jgi:hypothetical protein
MTKSNWERIRRRVGDALDPGPGHRRPDEGLMVEIDAETGEIEVELGRME